MNNKAHLLYACLLFLYSCNSGTTVKPPAELESKDLWQTPSTTRHVEPALYEADSLQVIFYDDPGGDTLRYSRFFTHAATSDAVRINALLRELDRPYMQQPVIRQCRSEGKLYFLRRETILKTVYFSSRGDSCSYFYFIKDGSFYYINMTAPALGFLQSFRPAAGKRGAE